jgi:hypothetical protein
MKKQFGQFFTTNADYILANLEKYIKGKNATDPFAGNGDLMAWAKKHGAKRIIGFDVDKKFVNKTIRCRDSIRQPQKYDFVITNPPYLNINKSKDKSYFRDSGFEDLYQASLASIMDSNEGIAIVPINFLSAENSRKIRELFFSKFKIAEMNYFRHKVFPDTTYNVIAFYYLRKKLVEKEFKINTHIYPEGETLQMRLSEKYAWTIGGEVNYKINQATNVLGVHRLTEEHLKDSRGKLRLRAAYNHIKTPLKLSVSKELGDKLKQNIILLKAIDSGSPDGRIALEDIRNYSLDCLVSKPTSRHMIHLIFGKPISVAQQQRIIRIFNRTINDLRRKHLSLFLTNYRDNDRKRIGFDFVYKMINYIYKNETA